MSHKTDKEKLKVLREKVEFNTAALGGLISNFGKSLKEKTFALLKRKEPEFKEIFSIKDLKTELRKFNAFTNIPDWMPIEFFQAYLKDIKSEKYHHTLLSEFKTYKSIQLMKINRAKKIVFDSYINLIDSSPKDTKKTLEKIKKDLLSTDIELQIGKRNQSQINRFNKIINDHKMKSPNTLYLNFIMKLNRIFLSPNYDLTNPLIFNKPTKYSKNRKERRIKLKEIEKKRKKRDTVRQFEKFRKDGKLDEKKEILRKIEEQKDDVAEKKMKEEEKKEGQKNSLSEGEQYMVAYLKIWDVTGTTLDWITSISSLIGLKSNLSYDKSLLNEENIDNFKIRFGSLLNQYIINKDVTDYLFKNKYLFPLVIHDTKKKGKYGLSSSSVEEFSKKVFKFIENPANKDGYFLKDDWIKKIFKNDDYYKTGKHVIESKPGFTFGFNDSYDRTIVKTSESRSVKSTFEFWRDFYLRLMNYASIVNIKRKKVSEGIEITPENRVIFLNAKLSHSNNEVNKLKSKVRKLNIEIKNLKRNISKLKKGTSVSGNTNNNNSNELNILENEDNSSKEEGEKKDNDGIDKKNVDVDKNILLKTNINKIIQESKSNNESEILHIEERIKNVNNDTDLNLSDDGNELDLDFNLDDYNEDQQLTSNIDLEEEEEDIITDTLKESQKKEPEPEKEINVDDLLKKRLVIDSDSDSDSESENENDIIIDITKKNNIIKKKYINIK